MTQTFTIEVSIAAHDERYDLVTVVGQSEDVSPVQEDKLVSRSEYIESRWGRWAQPKEATQAMIGRVVGRMLA